MIDFVADLTWRDVPADVQRHVTLLLRDFAAVSVAGRATPTARIAADYAAAQNAGDEATAIFDGRRLASAGAAFANGVLANALDFDDGHRLVKGHPGANVIPAALAAAELSAADEETVRAAIAIGYEVALRAGIDLHARSSEYHASGAWGALGAAAAAARLLGLDAARTGHALGLAEFHAPIAPVLRSVADPAMTKDACGWGAFVGVSSALLARSGFTAVGSTFVAHAPDDFGERWRVREVYVKEFPCCRWSHPAVAAALRLRTEIGAVEEIARVRVRTFAAAAELAARAATTTEEAQYSLVWPVAVALTQGAFGVEQVLEPALGDAAALGLLPRIQVVVDAELDAAFPGRRLGEVTLELRDGRTVASGPTEPPGEAGDPRREEIVEAKLERVAAEVGAGSLLARLVPGIQPVRDGVRRRLLVPRPS